MFKIISKKRYKELRGYERQIKTLRNTDISYGALAAKREVLRRLLYEVHIKLMKHDAQLDKTTDRQVGKTTDRQVGTYKPPI